jgi:membrane protein required for colicin V production
MVVLGLAGLTINAIVPADRMPTWISGSLLYPLCAASGQALKAFAPQGAKLAKQVYPVVGNAITHADDNDDPGAADAQNRDYNQPPTNAPRLRVEKTP